MSHHDPGTGDAQVAQCIYPTHQCFTDAMEILALLLTEEHVPPTALRLVHAICLLPHDGSPFAHGWVEWGTDCLFLGHYQGERVLCSVERAAHYERLRVQERTKYTMPQAARAQQRTMSYGPWKPRYQALLRRAKEDETHA